MDQQPVTPGSQDPSPSPTPPPMQPPMQPMQPVSGMPPTGNGMNKKLIFGIVGGIVALLVIIVGIILAVTLGGVSQKDYGEAYDAAKKARTAYSEMATAAYVNTSGTKTELENDLDDLKDSRKDFDTATKELAETKAIKSDGEAKKLHEAFATKKKDFDKAMDAVTEVYEYVLPAVSEANKSIYTTGSYESSAKNMLEVFEDIDTSKLNDSNNKEFVDKMVSQLKTLQKTAKAYDDRFKGGSYNSNAYTNYSDARTEVSDTIRDWTSNFKKTVDDAEIKDEFNDLGEYLAQKASGR